MKWKDLQTHVSLIPVTDRGFLRKNKNCFSGSDATSHIMHFLLTRNIFLSPVTREMSVKIGQKLMDEHLFVCITGEKIFLDTDKVLFYFEQERKKRDLDDNISGTFNSKSFLKSFKRAKHKSVCNPTRTVPLMAPISRTFPSEMVDFKREIEAQASEKETKKGTQGFVPILSQK